MPIDVTLLLTHADCDAVATVLDKRLRLLDNREENFDYQDEVGSDRAQEITQELSGLNTRIPFLNNYLSTLVAGSKEHAHTIEELRKFNSRRDELLAQQHKLGGVKAVLSQSSLKETQSRSASIEADKALVIAHRATLPA
jgi:hypothetical protein